VRWRCSGSKDVSELELEGGRGNSSLLGFGLGSGDARLKGCEGSNEVGQSGGGGEVGRSSGGSRGGGGRGCHGKLLLLRHDLDGGNVLMRGGGHGLDGGDGCGQVVRSDVGGGRRDNDGVGVGG
jgi:hypothetical protein